MSTVELTDYTEKILTHIEGREWVPINELEQQLDLPEEKISIILDFLEFSKFVDVGKGRDMIKINKFGNMLLNIP